MFKNESGSYLSKKSDPDPVKNRTDPRPCLQHYTMLVVREEVAVAVPILVLARSLAVTSV